MYNVTLLHCIAELGVDTQCIDVSTAAQLVHV